MKQMLIFVSILLIAGFIANNTLMADNQAAPSNITQKTLKNQTLCPVMNEAINKKLYVDYEGKRIYVCCNYCVKTVKKDPAKYIKLIEDQGITLDKALSGGK
jgi:hypothetical protein